CSDGARRCSPLLSKTSTGPRRWNQPAITTPPPPFGEGGACARTNFCRGSLRSADRRCGSYTAARRRLRPKTAEGPRFTRLRPSLTEKRSPDRTVLAIQPLHPCPGRRPGGDRMLRRIAPEIVQGRCAGPAWTVEIVRPIRILGKIDIRRQSRDERHWER